MRCTDRNKSKNKSKRPITMRTIRKLKKTLKNGRKLSSQHSINSFTMNFSRTDINKHFTSTLVPNNREIRIKALKLLFHRVLIFLKTHLNKERSRTTPMRLISGSNISLKFWHSSRIKVSVGGF